MLRKDEAIWSAVNEGCEAKITVDYQQCAPADNISCHKWAVTLEQARYTVNTVFVYFKISNKIPRHLCTCSILWHICWCQDWSWPCSDTLQRSCCSLYGSLCLCHSCMVHTRCCPTNHEDRASPLCHRIHSIISNSCYFHGYPQCSIYGLKVQICLP